MLENKNIYNWVVISVSFDIDKKIVPIGIGDFKEFFDYNNYYIDKTILIKDILDKRSKVNLITWLRRFGNTLILSMIKYFFEINKNQIEILINSGCIRKTLNSNITYDELDENLDNILSTLFFTGYLTFVKERREENDGISYFDLKISSRELMYVYKTIIKNWLDEKIKSKDFSDLYNSLINGDEENLSDEISNLLLKNISYHDTSESFYHEILTGILSRIDKYRIYSNLETGLDRSDIILDPTKLRQLGIIIEIKTTKNIKELESKCEEALEQIEAKKHEIYLEKLGFDKIIKYGIAFCGKICLVKKV